MKGKRKSSHVNFLLGIK